MRSHIVWFGSVLTLVDGFRQQFVNNHKISFLSCILNESSESLKLFKLKLNIGI